MNGYAIRYYDTKVYQEYKSNITVLENTVFLSSCFSTSRISFYIIDNNKKYFKKQYLCDDFLRINSIDEITKCINVVTSEYIMRKIGYKVKREINNKLVNDWRNRG